MSARLPAPARRASILAAARTRFAASGYDATTTRMIAADAGVTDAIIYRHFPSKYDLLTALIDEMTAEFAELARPDRPVAGPVSTADLLALVGRRFAAALESHLDLLVLLLTHREALADDDRFVRFIEQAATSLGGMLDPVDPDRGYLAARGFMGAIAAFGLLQRTLGLDRVHPVDGGAYVAALVEQYSAGTPAA